MVKIEMTATGSEVSNEVQDCAQESTLIPSLRKNNDVVLVEGPDGVDKWYVSRALLKANSQYFDRELQLRPFTRKIPLQSPYLNSPVFELFLQWLYTGHYQEYDGLAFEFNASRSESFNCLLLFQDIPEGGMNWRAKAAFLACRLGASLESPLFQDYGMDRLIAAYSQDTSKTFLNPKVFHELGAGTYCVHMQYFFEDLAIRNWGDTSMLDHTDPEWSQLLMHNERFRTEFAKAMGRPLDARRAEMEWNKYYVAKT